MKRKKRNEVEWVILFFVTDGHLRTQRSMWTSQTIKCPSVTKNKITHSTNFFSSISPHHSPLNLTFASDCCFFLLYGGMRMSYEALPSMSTAHIVNHDANLDASSHFINKQLNSLRESLKGQYAGPHTPTFLRSGLRVSQAEGQVAT